MSEEKMVNHSSGYLAVMELSKSPIYSFGEKTSNWLDVIHGCYLAQMEAGIGDVFYATSVTSILRRIKPEHGYFPALTKLVGIGILKKLIIPGGGGKQIEPLYMMPDPNGVALALHELGYL